jgi:hypothetical protein
MLELHPLYLTELAEHSERNMLVQYCLLMNCKAMLPSEYCVILLLVLESTIAELEVKAGFDRPVFLQCHVQREHTMAEAL